MNILDTARRAKHQLLVAKKAVSRQGRSRTRLRRSGLVLDDSVFVHWTARVDPGVELGHGTWVNEGAKIDQRTVIGKEVGIAPGAFLCTVTHEIGTPQRRAGRPYRQGITVGDGCWIGANATILPGVTGGAGCVIAAGAVVIADCTPNGLYAGVPARRIRDLPTN